jgi:hypothetical protein
MVMVDEKQMMTWPKKLLLKRPIKVERDKLETEVKELSIQQLKSKHLRHVPIEPTSPYFIVPLVASLTGLTEAEAGELDLADLMAVAEVLGPFLEGLPTIGKK